MKNFNKLSIEYNLMINQRLKDIAGPLQNFGISHFSYLKILPNKKRLFLSTNHEWYKKYIAYSLYNSRQHQNCYPTSNHITYSLWPSSMDDDDIFLALNENGICHGFNIYIPYVDFIEGFHFATTKDNLEIRNYYQYLVEDLKRFIIFFNNNMDSFLEEGNNLITSEIDPLKRINEEYAIKVRKFINETPINKYPLYYKGKRFHINKKSAQCSKYLSIGKTMKEISNIMKISPRTVECYLYALTAKIGCSTNQLRDIAKENFYESLVQTENFIKMI